MGISIQFDTKAVLKQLKGIQKDDIPYAQIMAGKDAAKKGASVARRAVAKDARVPMKYVNRFRTTGGNKRKREPRAAVYFKHLHINPAGTKKHPNAVQTLHRITKTGKRGKGHGNLKAMGHTYERAFLLHKSTRYRVPLIMQRKGSNATPIDRVTIPLGTAAVAKVRRIVKKEAPPVYARRFEHHFNRRMARRGTR